VSDPHIVAQAEAIPLLVTSVNGAADTVIGALQSPKMFERMAEVSLPDISEKT
jgi:hypothetical protein